MGPMPRLLSEITSNGEAAFPWKLHRVLEESERCGFSDIVSWQGNRAFKVHDPKNFEKSIMKKYFNQTRYKSFQRQLNIYGFERITIGTDIGSYTHHLLVRGKPNICRFMVRTKVKNKGSKATANSTNGLSRTSHVPNKRRASTIGARSLPQHPQALSKITRSISCPGATKITNEQFIPNQNISGLSNDVFQADPRKIQSLRLQNNHLSDIGENNNLRSIPSTTIEDGFSDDIFSSDSFEADFHPVANVSVDGNYNNNNSTGTNMGHRRDMPMPSLLLCDNSSQDDITVLGNSNRSTSTQASDMGFQQSQQPPQLDPFHPRPIPEHELPQQDHRLLQQQQMMEQQQQQRREQECHMLEMQIQHLQNRIVSLNQHTQDLQTVPNNTNYLCNGVAAIGPNDRGTVTPTRSPDEIYGNNSCNNNSNKSNHPLRQLERDSDPNELMSLNPTPIFTPFVPVDQDCGTMGGNNNNNMRRSISFCSYPQMVPTNVP